MENEKKNLDEFWDISSLIPQKRSAVAKPQKNITAAEIVVSTKEPPQSSENLLHIKKEPTANASQQNKPEQKNSNKPYIKYENPSGLIKETVILDWKTPYNYYDLFAKQARYYKDFEGEECECASFFSYMPQYSQMTKNQLDWYFWWRKNINRGIYLDTPLPYIQLYAFELINTCTESTAEQALDIMINLWSNYCDTYPQLNMSLGEWVCDLSLIYRLPITFPDKRITKKMINGTTFPEAFYSFDFHDMLLLAKFLLSYCNSYNYRKSRIYTDETRELFDKHIVLAFERLISKKGFADTVFSENLKKTHRMSFIGALCTNNAKKRIELVYCSPRLESELKVYVTNAVKHIENTLRGAIGVRSKLGIKNIDEDAKQIIAEYFFEAFGRAATPRVIVPEYEKLYDAKNDDFSVAEANAIESRSWDVTKKLVDSFEETVEYREDAPEIAPPVSEHNTEDESPLSQFYSKISEYRQLFDLIIAENYAEQLSYVKKNKLILEAVVDEINEAAVDAFEDIIVEEGDLGYKIIDDYKELLENKER